MVTCIYTYIHITIYIYIYNIYRSQARAYNDRAWFRKIETPHKRACALTSYALTYVAFLLLLLLLIIITITIVIIVMTMIIIISIIIIL